jgi:hypothetical protein
MATTGTIKGKVSAVNTSGGTVPPPQISVVLDSLTLATPIHLEVNADSSGEFNFPGLDAASYRLTFPVFDPPPDKSPGKSGRFVLTDPDPSDSPTKPARINLGGTANPSVVKVSYELQDFKIDGHVTDGENPLAGVPVSLDSVRTEDPAIRPPSPGQIQTAADGSFKFEHLVRGSYTLTFDSPVFVINPKTGVKFSYFLSDARLGVIDVEVDSDLPLDEVKEVKYILGDESVPPSVVRPTFAQASRKWDDISQDLDSKLKPVPPQLAAFKDPIQNVAKVAKAEALWLDQTELAVKKETAGFLLGTLGFRLRDNAALVRGALEGLIANLGQLALDTDSKSILPSVNDINTLKNALQETLDKKVKSLDDFIVASTQLP